MYIGPEGAFSRAYFRHSMFSLQRIQIVTGGDTFNSFQRLLDDTLEIRVGLH